MPYSTSYLNDFELVYTNGNDDDFENMKIIYENLKDLTDSQASDERIWPGLAHHYFWNSTKAPFLNGLSRLWWYARYTYNENLEDPYELTKYICENDINGKIFPLVSCSFVTNREVFQNIIKSVKNYEQEKGISLTRNQFNEIKKYLNRLSGKIVIDLLDENELCEKITTKLNSIII